MSISQDKLPRNIDAEKALLGAILTSSEVKDQALAELALTDFFLPIHQKIFEAIFNLNDKNISVDVQTVTQELKNIKALEEVGGVEYLFELTQSLISIDNANEYLAIIKENANLRNFFLTINDIESDYLKGSIGSYTTFVGESQRKLDKIAEQRRISAFKSSSEVAEHVEKAIIELSQTRREGDLTGVDTGFTSLNHYTNGLQKENLIIVAGRTGLGKTAFALNLILNAAKSGVPVGIFEMEMSSLTLYSRLIANDASVSGRNILNGRLNQKQLSSVRESLRRLANLKIYVDESSAVTIYDLVAKARKLKSEQPDLGLIVIDYLGLITSDNKRNRKRFESRQLEIQEYTRTLHELARELKIPVVALCQLNRKVEDRGEGGTPRLSDLRESGSIEQDAEIVILLHNSDYGKNDVAIENERRKRNTAANMNDDQRRQLVAEAARRTTKENLDKETKSDNSVAIMDIIIAKNRNGESDRSFKLLFEKEYSRFSDLPDEFYHRLKEINDSFNKKEEE